MKEDDNKPTIDLVTGQGVSAIPCPPFCAPRLGGGCEPHVGPCEPHCNPNCRPACNPSSLPEICHPTFAPPPPRPPRPN